MVKDTSFIADIHNQLDLFFGSRQEEWSIVLTGERYPKLEVRVVKQFDRQKFVWNAVMDTFSVNQAAYEGTLKLMVNRFVEEIKRKVKEGPVNGDN